MSKMADDDPWLLKEDGCLNVDTECKSIIYHANLNVLLITTGSTQVYVFDVNSGVILQRSTLSGKSNGKLQGLYLPNGIDKVLYTDGRGIGIRSDYNGVLLLDTILQTPVSKSDDVVKLELLLSEAALLLQCLQCVELPGVEHLLEVLQELSSKIVAAQTNQKKGIKAQKWNTICLELPHGSLKLVCSSLVMELKRQNRHIPALPIASAINERLNGLLPGLALEGGPADRALMFSEAARRDTFPKWPHMNYKWALPDQMAQAGFYHEPNATGDDRAMCFTCNVCLVCWEPTDEPWSEHERHSPACPFVKGEYTQNVPLSVTLATAPAREVGDTVDIIGTTNVTGLAATASSNGFINIWNITNQLKREVSFYISLSDQEVNNKESIQFCATRNMTTSYLTNLSSDTAPLSEYKSSSFYKVQITALSVVGSPISPKEEVKSTTSSTTSSISTEASDYKIRPCLVCGVTVTVNNPSQLRTLENVWATSTDLASSSSLVRAMNSVNSAASDTLDIMKVAGDRCIPSRLHYLVLYDFHHKTATAQPIKEDNSKESKTKKTLSGTGTSASSNGGRQESLYQELFLGKFLYEVPVIEDVDSEMVVGPHYDGIFPTIDLTASSSNGIYSTPIGITAPTTSTPYDSNFNPINSSAHFASTSNLTTMNKKSLDLMKITKAEPVVIKTLAINAPDSLRIMYISPTKDGRHLYVAMCPSIDNASAELSSLNTNQMDVDDESDFFPQKSYMYWDHSDTQSGKLINDETRSNESNTNVVLLLYALDFSGPVVQVMSEPLVKRELPLEQAPIEHELLPLQEKQKRTSSSLSPGINPTSNSVAQESVVGQVALVCKDGVVRLLNLSTLKIVTEARLEGKKFISATYCNSLERLCVCTSDGTLHFFVTAEEEDSTEEKEDVEDVIMVDKEGCANENMAPNTSTSTCHDQLLAHKTNFSYTDLRLLYELTRFDRHSPAYSATVPPCWSEMMQAQRQRRHPQHLHQSEDQHHTRTWRLQNDTTTWDEHVFELTLPRSASGSIGHVDVRFTLHSFCQELPTIQITLLKQNIKRIGHQKASSTPVDERIDFNLGSDQRNENPVITEEYQRQHNTEILCGPIDLHRCMDLSCRSGCVTLTSPKLFRSKVRTLLVHIKALVDQTKDGASAKAKVNPFETKPPTCKKLRIFEVRPLVPNSTGERLDESGNSKKLGCYVGCNWIHEISITVRSVRPTDISNERLQRCAMLESKTFFDNLLNVACLQGSLDSPVVQSIALDILVWAASIRLTRLRSVQNSAEMKALQLETIRSVQGRLSSLLRSCLLHAGRSIAHKCVKLIVLCSGGFYNIDDPPGQTFDEAILSVLVNLLPSIIDVQWAGSLRWLQLLITRFLPLDRNHSIAQKCVSLVQQIATELSNRVNPYHLLLATRFGLYNTPFETELFDLEPPILPKFSSTPVTYATVVTDEQTGPSMTSSSSAHLPKFAHCAHSIDLRDLLTLPTHPASEFVVPSKLKALCTNHNMKGLLEVEPLHFTCHAASDGTKMENIGPGMSTINIGPTLYDNTATNNSGASDVKMVHYTYNLDAGSLGPDVQTKSSATLSDLLSMYTGRVLKKPSSQLLLTPDEQSDYDEANDTSVDNQTWHNTQNNMPSSHILSSIITKEKSSVQNLDTAIKKVEEGNLKKREDITFPWGRLLCWPPQQALVVERMHSGARRFVILDFGSPVLLTDLMIPSCSDLVSLSIDIWTKSEETDGTRLIVAGDIGSKPLIVCDLQPPPVCRYLKITTIGRYGMSTTTCKIPLGMFYGHMVVLPGENYSELSDSLSFDDNIFDPSLQATIDTQCNILSALAEDVQCRFSLANERLKALLDPLLCSETPNVMHMQHYLCCNKIFHENNERPSPKILQTYQECIMFQHQLNIVRGVWRRLESWRGLQNVSTTSFANAPSDKLRVLGETLLDILLYTVYEIGPVANVPMSLYEVFTPTICEKFFHSICVVTPAPRLQLHAAALLAGMAGHQPWWGNFLSNTLINLYSSSSTHVFPQDRVFILLTFLGRKSLMAGANKSSVIDAMVRTLGKLLSPLTSGQSTNSHRLDVILIGWVLLFLSVCLDTTTIQPPCMEDNQEKNKEQGLLSRWEFIQGESAMQRKYVNASRSSASRSYRKRLQKRLLHHKQQLHELEQAKKSFQTTSQAATLYSKVEATIKSQERYFKKTLKQHSAKHYKDILGIRRNETQHLSRSPRASAASSSKSDVVDLEVEYVTNLSHQYVLPVARGLVALILHNTTNVDMFLLACKVVARLVVSTRPAISLCELMTEEQLLKLVRLATGTSDATWSSHAVSCLLLDLLEGGRLFPRTCPMHEGSPTEESFEMGTDESHTTEEDSSNVAGTSASSVATLNNSEGFAEVDIEEDAQDSIVVTSTAASTSKSNGFLPSLLESDDSELEEFLDDILERGRNMLKKGSTVSKILTSAITGSISLAMDARLEYGVEMGVEISLRILSTVGMYNLPHSINAPIHMPMESNRPGQQSSMPKTDADWGDRSQETWNSSDPTPSSFSMLTKCFDKMFTDLYLQQNNGMNLELVLQLWLTLNMDTPNEHSHSSSQFDSSLTPVIPLSLAAISNLISALSWHSGISLRAWCLGLQCLTIVCNQSLQRYQGLDGFATSGFCVASCIVKEHNTGPMLLRLLSGNGLNVSTMDEQYIMAGPTVCQALHDFLLRLEVMCDVITPDSFLGNSLKDLLLWVVYQLVQPGGALITRRGPLDVQCKLLTSVVNLNYVNADLNIAMNISECVGVLVSTYVRGSGVGAECGGALALPNQSVGSGGFGGLFACVLGGDTRQGRPASWDTLIVTLVKLVCVFIQTPLPGSRENCTEKPAEEELSEATSDPRASTNEPQVQINISQTDESKVAEQQTSFRLQQPTTSKSCVPCLADTVLQHEPTMMRLLSTLGHITGSSLAMLLGGSSSTVSTTELRDPASIPDAIFLLLTILTKKASNPTLVLKPFYHYLSSSCGETELDRQLGVMQLSEPLLWYILRVLDNVSSLSIFTEMGGVKVVCQNLVKSSNSGAASASASGGVIALVMEHLSNAPNVMPITTSSSSSSSKKAVSSLESNSDGLLNFAPLGTISCATAQPPDVLIQNTTPHKRARTPAWSYHYYPDEKWVDLTITLPCAILLRQVELQPHHSALSTCPSAVALEISRENNSPVMPVCPPMPTAGLTYIRLTLSQPEVVTSVLVRLYKPRDSTNVSLSQIKLMGTTAFGENKTSFDMIDEEQLTKTSLGWLRLLHQCLSVSTLNSNLATEVLNSAASVEGLVEACCNLLLLPAPSLFTANLERVLLQLGLHSRELGLHLIGLLLNNRSTPFFQGAVTSRKTSVVQLVVELLQQLCSIRDSSTEARMKAVLGWLQTSATNGVFHTNSNPNSVNPSAVYIHCVSSIIWKTHQQQNHNYDLQVLLTDDLFNSLYQWTLTLGKNFVLKQAIDSVLCAFCYVRPSLFPLLLQRVRILVPNLATDHSASISDDRKKSEGQTDDKKSEINAEEWYCRFVLLEYKRLRLTEGQLLTVAAAARSPPGIQQLIDSGFPALLTALITDFCNLEKSKQHQRTTMASGDSNENNTTENVRFSDNDDLCMMRPDSIAMVIEFLMLVCSEGRMRDWLGKEGRGFWLPLLSLLSNRPIENSSASASRCSKISASYTSLESAIIKFLSRCCWCHQANQKLLAELLTEVVSQQRMTSNVRYLHGISGFTRRLILQLLLEGEKVLVSVTSEAPMKVIAGTTNYNMPSMSPHPAHPFGHYHQLLYMPTQATVADILRKVSGTWFLLLLPNTYKGNEASSSENNRVGEPVWQPPMELMVDTLSVAAGNTAKDKRAKEASNRSQARGPIVRKPRLNSDGTPITSKPTTSNGQVPVANQTNTTNQQYLIHSSRPNTPLPLQLTIAQLLAIAEDSGVSLSEPYLHLILRQRNKDSKEDITKQNDSELLNYRSIESSLGVFSAGGGLAVLARHLPLVYPDSGRPLSFVEKSPSPEQTDADWVKLETNDDIYEALEEGRTYTSSPKTSTPPPYVPPHSLAAFGLFLRLPGYAEVLLRDKKRAQCLLRLALGVSDDGEGGEVLSSPLAASLPTLPFQVLKQLLDATPPTTDDGLLLRRTTIEVGAMLLLLNCLAIFTHQTGQNEPTEQRTGQSSSSSGVSGGGGMRNDDNSHLYWAKGTGFGTGSTQQSWNVEQALLRQRCEDEHVTVLLQVLASYIGSGGGQPQRELPAGFPDLLARSCLLPALSSYLRNDSVLDMARHIPLYRAVLQLLRAMALSTQLAPLLLPRGGRSGEPSVVSLLSSMKVCVDTYMHKINRTRGNKSKSVSKYPDDSEQDEGLATLIPDIQESATIVQNATCRLSGIGEELPGPSPIAPELPLRSIEHRYLEVMKNLQFDTYEMITENPDGGGYKFAVSYHFESNMRAAGERSHPTRVKRLAQEAVTLSTALPLSYSSSVFVRCDADRLDVMKVLITGPAETPYANGCFEFDVYFPPDYPNSPMLINLETTGRHTVRFNPNLYNDGKVCLSVLNTWHGRPEEKWNAHTSSFLQVLVSIQSLILVSEPYFNEPGYERSRGTSSGAQSSQEYNANICQATAKWAMLDQIRNPCPCFKEVIHTHFWMKRHEIVAQLEGWIRDMEMHGSDRRSGRSISLNALSLRRHYRLLREELNKLPTPEGLEDLAEPLLSPGSPIELSGTPGTTPNTPSTVAASATATTSSTIITTINNSSSNTTITTTTTTITTTTTTTTITTATTTATTIITTVATPIISTMVPINSSTSSHVHHDIDTDVEMEKMVSKVCE
ncbi:baculoviral IAP repeat-containing protein 6 isoform X6 [Odontomachus brunneus]|uniref:baculoviral IAP repeat-containing protein 6 isoform X6 n=1 Tax=Odontomachus brunneus TaxID=486640 RepID=UPI0013F26401|nr:baculoviral IAP repeat-containing protein 6 isoform X6 [Odontomachus brunneus]